MMEDRLSHGRYKLQGVVGEGGITRVYGAIDTLTGARVAIKELKSADPAAREALTSEFYFSSLYRHPALLAPLSFFKQDDCIFLVQPFVEGVDLKSWWSAHSGEPELSRYILASVLECAAFIHFSGFTYNDFKPANIVVVERTARGPEQRFSPIILDYNLIARKESSPSRRGTIDYMAPEVLRGEHPKAASDIYSIGALIFELLTGEAPFCSDDSETLIKLVLEEGEIDYSKIPESYRDGLGRLLARDPSERPPGAREAAAVLGLKSEFDSLYRDRIDSYLSAGPPPFAEELKTAFEEYIAGLSSKIFIIRTLNHNRMATDYLAASYLKEGYRVWRTPGDFSYEDAKSNIEIIREEIREYPENRVLLLIDEIEKVGDDALQLLKLHGGPENGIPVIAGAGRWTGLQLPACIFDPLANNTRKNSAVRSFETYSKDSNAEAVSEAFIEVTGGDPHLTYLQLKYACVARKPNLLSENREYRLPVSEFPAEVRDAAVGGIAGSLDERQLEVMKKLSIWGNTIPLLALIEMGDDDQKIVDHFIKCGRLIAEKDAVSFPSGLAGDFIRSRLGVGEARRIHHFWAETVEKRFIDSDEYLELAAVHWGGSDEVGKGYKANLRAVRQFLERGELSLARKYAFRLQELSAAGGGSEAEALLLYAAVLKREGDYGAARGQYLKLIRRAEFRGDKGIEARAFNELGDVYRSLKKINKAIRNTEKALKLYTELNDTQGIADCNNNMGLTYWVDEQYGKALGAFYQAFDSNVKLENHRELAKIQSNLGIIKDIVGNTGEVADHFLQARRHASAANDPRLEALIANNLGFFQIRQGEYEKATGHLQDALTISEKIGYTEGIIHSLSNLGLCHMRSGNLFVSVEYNQKALDTAESFGNRHQAASAETYLVEACILMGNYSLADEVLRKIEEDPIFNEDKSLKPQVELLRSRLQSSLGKTAEASKSALGLYNDAEVVGDRRLGLEAGLVLADALLGEDVEGALAILLETADKASSFGHGDIVLTAAAMLAEIYVSLNEIPNAEGWMEKIGSSAISTREVQIRGNIIKAELLFNKRKYDEALDILYETESIAAVSGFIPLALRSAVISGEIFVKCSKVDRAREAIARASSYRARLLSAISETDLLATYEKTRDMVRLRHIIAATDKKELFEA